MNRVIEALPTPPSGLGECPLWDAQTDRLYWVDIPGRALHRFALNTAQHQSWGLPAEPGCLALVDDGRVLLALRTGLVVFDPESGSCSPLAVPLPYDPAVERFNDGKVDPHGYWWIGTIYEPRDRPAAQLYRLDARGLAAIAGDCTVSNGLAWSPQGGTLYWSDTKAHQIVRLPLGSDGLPSGRREPWCTFAPREPDTPLSAYGGRPDGAAMDVEGHYWSALFEGQQLVRIAPSGEIVQRVPLPVRCATMPAFGGPDLRTLYITTARHQRPADELAAQPLAGHVLTLRVDVAGVPIPRVRATQVPPLQA